MRVDTSNFKIIGKFRLLVSDFKSFREKFLMAVFLKLVGMSIVGVEPLSTYHILFYQHLQFKDTMSIFDDFFFN